MNTTQQIGKQNKQIGKQNKDSNIKNIKENLTNYFEKLRNIFVQQDAVCQNIDYVIQSKDFRRGFSKVLRIIEENNHKKIMKTLSAIQDEKRISNEDQTIFLECISDPKFKFAANITQNKLMGFSARNAYDFLYLYPVSEILSRLKEYISDEIKAEFSAGQDKNILDIPDNDTSLSPREYTVMNTMEISGEKYTLMYTMIGGNKKRGVKKHGELIYQDDFSYDFIGGFSSFYGNTLDTTISKVKVGGKYAYQSISQILNKETDVSQDIFFDGVDMVYKIDGKIYYQATLDNKKGFVSIGNENNEKENIKFDYIKRVINKYNGRDFYYVEYEGKNGYMEFGKDIGEEDMSRLSAEIIKPISEDKNGNVVYSYKKPGKWLGMFKTITHTFKKLNNDKEIKTSQSLRTKFNDFLSKIAL